MAEYKCKLLRGLFAQAKNVINSAGGSVEELSNNSETEHIIGKWIDGTTLYEKTIDCGGLPSSGNKTVVHNISNLNKIVEIRGIAIRPGVSWYPLPFTTAGGNAIGIDVNSTTVILRVGSTDYSNYTESYMTLRYTKTV